MQENWIPRILLVGMLNHAADLENYLAAPQMIKHRVTILSNNPTPIYKITEGIENICSHKNLYTNVHSSIICNSWKVKAAHVSISSGTERSCELRCVQRGGIYDHTEWNIDSVGKTLSASCQIQKAKLWRSLATWNAQKDKHREMGLTGSQGWEAGGLGTGIMGTKFLSELVTTSWTLLVVMDT